MASRKWVHVKIYSNKKTCGKCRFWFHEYAPGALGYDFYSCNLFHEFLEPPEEGKDTQRLQICKDSEI